MIEQKTFSPKFLRELSIEGFPVEDIASDIAKSNGKGPVKIIRNWTGLPGNTIREGLFNEDRDVSSPKIKGAILGELAPWKKTQTDEAIPTLSVEQIARSTGFSPEKVLSVLTRYPITFSINGSRFESAVQVPEFQNGKVELSESSRYGVSPKRVVKDARYLSRPPGGGAVQKAGIQDAKIDGIIRTEARKKAKIVFESIEQIATTETTRRKNEDNYIDLVWQEISKIQITNPEYPNNILARLTRARDTSKPVMLFVPWGVRPEGEFGKSEIAVLEKLKFIQNTLKKKGIPAKVLIMPADLYATEVNSQVGIGQAAEYFQQVTQTVQSEFYFDIKPWSEIRMENWKAYQTRSKELTIEEINKLLTKRKIVEAIGAATRRSGYNTQEDIIKAAYAYLRERICEAEIVENKYKPVKVSAVPKNKDNEIDINLPRLYIIPAELQLPWLK